MFEHACAGDNIINITKLMMTKATFRSSRVFVRLRNGHQPEYSYVCIHVKELATAKKSHAAKGAARTETATKKWLEDVPCTVTVRNTKMLII